MPMEAAPYHGAGNNGQRIFLKSGFLLLAPFVVLLFYDLQLVVRKKASVNAHINDDNVIVDSA